MHYVLRHIYSNLLSVKVQWHIDNGEMCTVPIYNRIHQLTGTKTHNCCVNRVSSKRNSNAIREEQGLLFAKFCEVLGLWCDYYDIFNQISTRQKTKVKGKISKNKSNLSDLFVVGSHTSKNRWNQSNCYRFSDLNQKIEFPMWLRIIA